MKEESRIYFHLGLPKAASTYLQRNVFPYLENMHFVKKHDFLKYRTLKNPDTHVLFSSEKDVQMEDSLDEILSYHPDARIIFILRSHDEWIKSRYKYHIRKFGSYLFNEFIDIESNTGFWKTEELYFSKKVEYFLEHCKHPPLILNFDMLKSSPDEFVRQITVYTGCGLKPGAKLSRTRNSAFNDKQLFWLRRFNKFYPYVKLKSSSRSLIRLHFRYRQYLLHIMVQLFRFFPAPASSEAPLVDKKELLRIKEFYKEDWELCLKYISKSLQQ